MAQAQTLAAGFLILVFAVAVEPGKPVLYYFFLSPPCRTVLMTAKVLGFDLDLKVLDIKKGEQFTTQYLEVNPQHTVPALDDNGFTLSESRAIIAYLASTSRRSGKLYPRDPKRRARIDQIMDFDLGRLNRRMLNFYVIDSEATIMVLGAAFDQRKSDLLDGAFEMLEKYLTKNTWVAGRDMTIADIAVLTTVSMAEVIGYNVTRFPKTNQWLAKMKTLIPDYKALNEDGIRLWVNASKAALDNVTKH